MTLQFDTPTGDQVNQADAIAEAREREAAMHQILQVIAKSRDDEAPVFDVILENAQRLCEAPMAGLVLGRPRDAYLILAAHHGANATTVELFRSRQVPMDPEVSFAARAIVEGSVIHLEDMADTELYRSGHGPVCALVDDQGVRTNLLVPLIAKDGAIGALILYRTEVRPYTDSQIALVETFAAQAVIAIENVKQFRELQTRLEREAATREILEVVSQSRDDTAPVFATILESVRRLCNVPLAFLSIANEERTHVSVPASVGARPEFAAILEDFNEPIERSELIAVRATAEAAVVHLHDCSDDDLYRRREPRRVQLVEIEGVRTILGVPMISNGIAVGAIALYRREVAPFTEDEIALVQSFAAQAAIAIENERQFKALKARTEEVQDLNANLEARIEEQVGEIERIGRLKRFLSPQVADAVVSSGDGKMLGSHRALIASLFCDIRGFTAFCETAEPEETIEILQAYHEEMGKLINAHGAGFDHRSGDGIMVIFNDPLPCDDPASDAVRMAFAMRARMEEMCKGWQRLGHRLGFGVGISLGYATVGMVGSEGRYDYTASGTAVNLAARLCDEAADGDILLSPRAFAAVEDDFTAESIGELALKGIHAPVDTNLH